MVGREFKMSYKADNPYIETIISRADIQNSGYASYIYGTVIPYFNQTFTTVPFNQSGNTLGNSQQIEHGSFLKTGGGAAADLSTASFGASSGVRYYAIPAGTYEIDYRITFKVNSSPSNGSAAAHDYYLRDMDATQQLSSSVFPPNLTDRGFFTKTWLAFENVNTSGGITFSKSKVLKPCITTAGSIEANRVLVDFSFKGICITSGSSFGFRVGSTDFSSSVGFAGVQSYYSKITKLL